MSLFNGISKETAQQLLNDRLSSGPMTILELVEEVHSNPALSVLIGELYIGNQMPKERKKCVRNGRSKIILNYLKTHGPTPLKDLIALGNKDEADAITSCVYYLKKMKKVYTPRRGVYEVL